jgi:hypothetical protein
MKKRWLGTLFVVGSCAAVACSSSNTDSNASANGGSANGGSANGGSANGGSANGGSANGGSANGGSANANSGSANGGEADAGGNGGSVTEAGAGGSAEAGAGGSAGSASDEAGAAGAATGPTSFTLDFPTQTVTPGLENTLCVVLDLGNDSAVHIAEIHNHLSAGAFDLLVYKSSAATTSAPTGCAPLSSLQVAGGVPLMLSHRPDDDLVLPSGVGFTLAPHQKIGLELHFLSTVAQDISTQTTFTVASEPYQAEAGFIMLSNIDVSLPAGSQQITAAAYLPGTPLAAASIFRFVGYTHQLGTEVTLTTSASEAGTPTSIGDLDPTPTASPAHAVATFSPAVTLPTGGGFTLTCHYTSDPNMATTYGRNANNEQCAALLWYSPAVSSNLCLHTANSGGVDVCCPGGIGCSSL